MIKHLLIKNYALIEHLEMSPSQALNVITGETGAGKSIMLGALGLLIGNRADKKALFNEGSKCIVEGTFSIGEFEMNSFFDEHDLDYQEECIIRREITSAGKSRAFVNDTPTTLDVLKKIGAILVDIHSQNDTLLLSESGFQLNIIDQFGNTGPALKQYKSAFNTYIEKKNLVNRLKNEQAELNKESDYNKFILDELLSADLKEGELKSLEEQLEILENGEEIKTKFNQALAVADEGEYSASEAINSFLIEIKSVKNFSKEYENLFERLQSVQIELSDIINETRNYESDIEVNPEELHLVRERVDLLNRLLQKHVTKEISDLLALQAELEDKVGKVENFDEALIKAENDLKIAKTHLDKQADTLSKSRQKIFPVLSERLIKLLQKVGMPEATVSVEHHEIEPTKLGKDQINLLFSANKGISPQPLKNVASGGEFSRLMFCIKSLIAEKNAMPTMIFDEIDTGVSGEIALKMISLMKSMSESHQIISISHLPQFAAGADTHYFVYKDNASSRSVSRMKKLSDDERIENIAKMIGGENMSESAIQSAKDLLTIS
ncbi:MAG: DNA repair protein RecN [Bacteroidota bacterium]